ncbi:MAG TPA: tetratricopeptide repeat protein [Desulfobulbus sp.]|nr:tetratricopeptide repeat protein [Desulfobulbus sp.]
MVHYKRKAFTLARNEFAQAVEKKPDVPVFRYHLAMALHGEGKKKEAIRELKEALAKDAPFKEKAQADSLLKKWESEI